MISVNRIIQDPVRNHMSLEIQADYHDLRQMFPDGNVELEPWKLLGPVLKQQPKVKRVIFNGPATVVFWDDGEKTVVKLRGGATSPMRRRASWPRCSSAFTGTTRTCCAKRWGPTMIRPETSWAQKPPVPDPVDHPSHYERDGMQTIDIVETVVEGLPARQAFLLGCLLKYVIRCGLKGDAETDLAKANNFAHRLCTGEWRWQHGQEA